MTLTQRATLLLTVLVCVGAFTGCTREKPAPADPPKATSEPRDDHDTQSVSIFDLSLALTDQDGHRLTLHDLEGHTMVAAMMYTTCTSVCPRITEDMKAIEAQLGPDANRDTRFVLFSLDPGRDTPEALRHFAAEHQLGSRWHLYATSLDGVRDLAAVLGVKYQTADNGESAHSAMIFIIDGHGIVRHKQVGLTPDVRPIVAALLHVQG